MDAISGVVGVVDALVDIRFSAEVETVVEAFSDSITRLKDEEGVDDDEISVDEEVILVEVGEEVFDSSGVSSVVLATVGTYEKETILFAKIVFPLNVPFTTNLSPSLISEMDICVYLVLSIF